MGNLNKNLSTVSDEDMQGGGGWKVKPDGYYRVTLTKAEVGNPNDKGTVQMFAKHSHLDERFKGKEEHDYITVSCPSSPKAQSIGEAQLKMLAIAVGHPDPNVVSDTNELMTSTPYMLRLYSRDRKSNDMDKRVDSDGRVQEIGGYITPAEFALLPPEKAKRPGMEMAAPMPASNGLASQSPPMDDDGILF